MSNELQENLLGYFKAGGSDMTVSEHVMRGMFPGHLDTDLNRVVINLVLARNRGQELPANLEPRTAAEQLAVFCKENGLKCCPDGTGRFRFEKAKK